MKRLLVAVLFLVLIQSAAFAQTGFISIFSDPNGVDCLGFDIPGLVTLYIFHQLTPGATASAFAVEESPGFNMIYLATTWNSPIIVGDPRQGVQIGYGGCFASPIPVGQMLYFGQGISATCSTIRVVNHPDWDCVGAVLCSGSDLLQAAGGLLYMNSDGTCNCIVANRERQNAQPSICIPVPVEETTWGAIKALYY